MASKKKKKFKGLFFLNSTLITSLSISNKICIYLHKDFEIHMMAFSSRKKVHVNMHMFSYLILLFSQKPSLAVGHSA